MPRTRTIHACHKAANKPFDWDAIAPNYTSDSDGNQRYREADLAAQHLASLSPERRAQLEREWHNPEFVA